MRQQRFAFGARLREQHLPFALPGVGDGLQQLGLELLAEALEGPDLAELEGALQIGEAAQAQGVVELPSALGTQAGQLRDLQDAGRHVGPRLVEGWEAAGLEEGRGLLRDGGPDALDLGQAPFPHQRLEAVPQLFDGPGAAIVGAHLERILPVQLEELAQLPQGGGECESVARHGRQSIANPRTQSLVVDGCDLRPNCGAPSGTRRTMMVAREPLWHRRAAAPHGRVKNSSTALRRRKLIRDEYTHARFRDNLLEF